MNRLDFTFNTIGISNELLERFITLDLYKNVSEQDFYEYMKSWPGGIISECETNCVLISNHILAGFLIDEPLGFWILKDSNNAIVRISKKIDS